MPWSCCSPSNKNKQEDKECSREILNAVTSISRSLPNESQWLHAFSMDELNIALNIMKLSKALGPDGVFPEFLSHLGSLTKQWLLDFSNDILRAGEIPNEFSKLKILAVLKPGKLADDPSSYRAITLLSMERLIYNRISLTVEGILVPEQEDFRSKHTCADQFLALNTYIEAGFQKGLKTAYAFIDLSSAYDTVGKKGMVHKLEQVIPCRRITSLIQNMLSNRRITVHLNDMTSAPRNFNNGLPQASVLTPLLFNIYTYNIPTTTAQ